MLDEVKAFDHFYTIWQDCNQRIHSKSSVFEFRIVVRNFEEVARDFGFSEETMEGGGKLARHGTWTPPRLGWRKENTCFVVSPSKVAYARVIRDHEWEVVFLASKLVNTMAPEVAEMMVLEWAFQLTLSLPQRYLERCCDAKRVVASILLTQEPGGWATRSTVLFLIRLTSNS